MTPPFNHYIIQRAPGSKSLPEAQKGLAFTAGLKLLIPVIVVVPGIAALYLAQNGMLGRVRGKPLEPSCRAP